MKKVICLWLGACLSAAAAEDTRPNILFILVDDLRSDALSCNGHPFAQTPHIDRIAEEGANFRQAFVSTPLCFPSRASFLSGQYAHRHGIRYAQDRALRSHELVTFPLLLHRAGYETGFFGKWHLEREATPPPGIDRWVSFEEQGEFRDPRLFIDGEDQQAKGYLTDILTDHSVEFIRRNRTKPFMAYVSHKAVHAPFIPAARHRGLLTDVPLPRPASAADTHEGKPVLRRPGIKLSPKDSDAYTTDEMIRDQLRCLMAVDDSVGRLFDTLAATGQLERTLIVFSSDNGYFWGEHGLGGKHGPYEVAIHVPLLMRYPALIKAGTVLESFALNIDVAPTLLEAANVPVPAEMQGRSLLPLLKGDTRYARAAFLTEFFLGNGTNRFPTWQAVRDQRWKYIRYPDWPGMEELYDLQSDPSEMKNVIGLPASQATLQEMRQKLETLILNP